MAMSETSQPARQRLTNDVSHCRAASVGRCCNAPRAELLRRSAEGGDRQTTPITTDLILPPGPRWGWIERGNPAPGTQRQQPGCRNRWIDMREGPHPGPAGSLRSKRCVCPRRVVPG
jgi:hypothetical protein